MSSKLIVGGEVVASRAIFTYRYNSLLLELEKFGRRPEDVLWVSRVSSGERCTWPEFERQLTEFKVPTGYDEYRVLEICLAGIVLIGCQGFTVSGRRWWLAYDYTGWKYSIEPEYVVDAKPLLFNPHSPEVLKRYSEEQRLEREAKVYGMDLKIDGD